VSDQSPDPSSHGYRDHLVITKHVPVKLNLLQEDGKPTIGVHLIRPYPEARIWSIDHTTGILYAYWVDQRLTLPLSARQDPS